MMLEDMELHKIESELSRNLFYQYAYLFVLSVLPASRPHKVEKGCLCFIKSRQNSLLTAYVPGKSDHSRDINTHGAVTPGAENTPVPDNLSYFLQSFSVNLSFFFIQPAQGVYKFMGRHVNGVFPPVHIEEAAFSTQGTMNT